MDGGCRGAGGPWAGGGPGTGGAQPGEGRAAGDAAGGPDVGATVNVMAEVEARLVGQPEVVRALGDRLTVARAGIAPKGRPAGIFLFLGPTGTGKTHAVECLARALHGDERQYIRVDCGEFQQDHEIARLIGAPPGYLGHRETSPVFTNQRLAATASERSPLALVLFDEIEKASHDFYKVLLGIMDKGRLQLGDNTFCGFERTMIFMTSNLGSRAERGAGFVVQGRQAGGLKAARRHFPPEFMGRLDEVVTFRTLGREECGRVLDLMVQDFNDHLRLCRGAEAPVVRVTARAREALLDEGVSERAGARELRRALHRRLVLPLAERMVAGPVALDWDGGWKLRKRREAEA